jgi:hypothetical protein
LKKVMKKTELKNCPQWLLDANTENENVEIVDGRLVWYGGTWKDGTWWNGIWYGGIWKGGTWKSGTWHDGTWHNGTWNDGTWNDGTWNDGIWNDGIWNDGIWKGGTWHDGTWNDGTWWNGTWHHGTWKGGAWHGGTWNGKEDRLLFMSGFIGIVFDKDGYATAYRTTQKDGTGRHTKYFIQPEGEWYEEDVDSAGSGTCRKGIHVSSAPVAWTYFGIDPEAQMWEVKFKKEDLLDCDGEKARIRGGVFTKINYPF